VREGSSVENSNTDGPPSTDPNRPIQPAPSNRPHPTDTNRPQPTPLSPPPRVQADQERKLAAEARKERRQTGEIETLRGRLRELEAAQKDREEEVKGLRRSLRQRELSLLTGGGGGAAAAAGGGGGLLGRGGGV
jgi:hypothetical protein